MASLGSTGRHWAWVVSSGDRPHLSCTAVRHRASQQPGGGGGDSRHKRRPGAIREDSVASGAWPGGQEGCVARAPPRTGDSV